MEIKKGKFYKSDGNHGDTALILCTKSSLFSTTFEGVCVISGNNTNVGDCSVHWNALHFSIETDLLCDTSGK